MVTQKNGRFVHALDDEAWHGYQRTRLLQRHAQLGRHFALDCAGLVRRLACPQGTPASVNAAPAAGAARSERVQAIGHLVRVAPLPGQCGWQWFAR